MSDQTALEITRAHANRLGIQYHHKAGATKIQGLINDHLAAREGNGPGESEVRAPSTDPKRPLTRVEYQHMLRTRAKKDCGRLRRVRISCMNPAKREWPGEIISVGSAKLGTFKKYIPFNGEPYHIPQIIYDVLKDRKCSSFFTETDGRGQKVRKSKLIDEFAIEDLPPLTKEELETLRNRQAMANSGL